MNSVVIGVFLIDISFENAILTLDCSSYIIVAFRGKGGMILMGKTNTPLYQMIYNKILGRIKSGEYKSGDRIPSEKELAEEFDVSRITSRKALEMLANEGLIARVPGRGSYVTDPEREDEHLNQEGIKTSKNVLIGVILPDFSEAYGMLLLSGIEREAAKNNCFIVIRRSHGIQETEEKVIDELLDLGVDGIIIMPVHGEYYNNKILRLILDGFPIIAVDRALMGIPVPFVGTNNIKASMKATNYILELGHRNIAILSPPFKNTSTIEERIEGFIKSHAEHGVELDDSLWLTNLTSTTPGKNTKNDIENDIEKILNLINNHPSITCFYAVEYNIALLASKAAGIAKKIIPDDLSIICFDSPPSYIEEYDFTFIRQKEAEMGITALNLVLNQMKGKDVKERVYLDAELIIGNTVIKN